MCIFGDVGRMSRKEEASSYSPLLLPLWLGNCPTRNKVILYKLF